ncbi:MAG: hemerythrin domain-containing protein [Nitrospirae bacterium]|nr:hemerythrin domain-containing protein [Nitrospirota bacterium]
MEMKIPPSLKHEHGEMRASLEITAKGPGKSGEAAREVARLLLPHFKKEEEYALPPLDALAVMAGGGLPEEPKAIIDKADRLRHELVDMLREHQAIAKALETLYDAATSDARPELARFARRLLLHAQMEEQIYYPAALVIGEYLKLKTGRG